MEGFLNYCQNLERKLQKLSQMRKIIINLHKLLLKALKSRFKVTTLQVMQPWNGPVPCMATKY